MDDIRSLVISYGAKGLAWITYLPDGTVKSPILKYISDEQAQEIKQRGGAKDGDVVFIVCDKPKAVFDVI